MVRFLGGESSFHGLQLLQNSHHPVSVTFWALIFISGLGVVTYQIIGLVHTYLQKPTLTRLDEEYPKTGLLMPNLTVCILSRFNYTRVLESNASFNGSPTYLEFLSSSFLSAYSTTLYDMNYFVHATGSNLTEFEQQYNDSFPNGTIDLVRYFEEISFSCADIFPGGQSCWFENSYLFDCCIIARRFLAHNGPCFEYRFFQAKRSDGSNYFKQRLPGPVGGFGFLALHPGPYIAPLVFNAYEEAAIFLYLSPEDALLNRNPLAISPGTHAHISVVAEVHERAPGSIFRSAECETVSSLDYFDEFSYARCEVECMIKTFISKCNCTGVSTYIRNETLHNKFCAPRKGLECVRNYAYNLTEFLSTCRHRHCSSPCSWWEHRGSVTSGRVYHPKFSTLIEKYWQVPDMAPNGTAAEYPIRDSVILVDFYFDAIKYVVIREINSLTFETLISNIGGALGLWTGASIITLVHFMCYWFMSKFDNSRTNNEQTKSETIESELNKTNYSNNGSLAEERVNHARIHTKNSWQNGTGYCSCKPLSKKSKFKCIPDRKKRNQGECHTRISKCACGSNSNIIIDGYNA